jgi:hypothetical protein
VLLGFVPDFLICWLAARPIGSGWYGFFIAFCSLQAIYLFFWLKTAVWEWLLFWLYGKRQLAQHLENYLIESYFPAPDKY